MTNTDSGAVEAALGGGSGIQSTSRDALPLPPELWKQIELQAALTDIGLDGETSPRKWVELVAEQQSVNSDALLGYPLTDAGNARRLAMTFGHRLRYCKPMKAWLIWDDRRWTEDRAGRIVEYAKAVALTIHLEAASVKDDAKRKQLVAFAAKSQSRSSLMGMIELAQSETEVSVLPEQLDANPLLVNFANGTYDAAADQLRPHDPRDLLTKLIPYPYVPNANCPTWRAWLGEMMRGDAEMTGFLQELAGVALTGQQVQQLFIFYGKGANGKSTFIETLDHVAGDYSISTTPETLMARRERNADPDLFALRAARLVVSQEAQEGARLDEGRVKALVGGDTVSVRNLYSAPITFRPQFKLILATNHLPVIAGTDDGIWRRISPVPWTHQIPESQRDDQFKERLLWPEATGILAWAIEGLRRFMARDRRLSTPSSVMTLKATYRRGLDLVGAFIEEGCVRDPQATIVAGELYQAYKHWCEANGHLPVSNTRLAQQLAERDYQKGQRTSTGRNTWVGLRLRERRASDEAPKRVESNFEALDRMTKAAASVDDAADAPF